MIRDEPMPRRDLHGEKVGRREDVPVELEKLCPAHAPLAALWSGLQVMATQDITHGQLVDGMPQMRQSALNAAITPAWILFGHAHDELLDLLCHWGPPQMCAALAPIKLLGDQSLVPAQERVRRSEQGDLLEALAAKRVGERGKATAFRVRQAQPAATELGFEHTIFLNEIGDDLLLVPLQPAGHHGDEHVQDHSCSSGWKP